MTNIYGTFSHKNNYQKNTQRGAGPYAFTLLEVLVALSLVGIALLGFLRLHLISIATSDKVEILSRAMLLAQSKIAEIEATKQGPSNALSGTDDTQGTALHWQAQIQTRDVPWLRPTYDNTLQEVVVRVWWDQGIGKRQIEMSTIITGRNP